MVFRYLYSFSYAEPQLILCKDNARREQNEINKFISYAEPKLILCKDNPITFKHKIKGSETYLFSLNPTKILYFLKLKSLQALMTSKFAEDCDEVA